MVASGCVDELLPPAHAGSIFALLAERRAALQAEEARRSARAGEQRIAGGGMHACI